MNREHDRIEKGLEGKGKRQTMETILRDEGDGKINERGKIKTRRVTGFKETWNREKTEHGKELEGKRQTGQ